MIAPRTAIPATWTGRIRFSVDSPSRKVAATGRLTMPAATSSTSATTRWAPTLDPDPAIPFLLRGRARSGLGDATARAVLAAAYSPLDAERLLPAQTSGRGVERPSPPPSPPRGSSLLDTGAMTDMSTTGPVGGALSVGRSVQARIYRNGVFGRKPVVPIEPAALEEAAKRRMSPEAWAYVAGGAGQQRTARANLEAFDRHRIVPRMSSTSSGGTTRWSCSAAGSRRRCCSPRSGCSRWRTVQAERAVAAAARDLGLPMVISTQGSVPMEETAAVLGDSPRWYQLYWSRDDGVVDSFSCSGPRRSGATRSWSPSTPTSSGGVPAGPRPGLPAVRRAEGIAQYVSDPAFRRLAEQRAAETTARPTGEPTPRPTPSRGPGAGVDGTPLPGRGLRENLRSPVPRAAVETFLDVFSRPSLTLGEPRAAALRAPRCRSCSRASRTRGTRRWRSSTASTASSCPTTAAGRSTARSARWTPCPGSWRRSTAGSRCSSTAASAAAPTRSRRSRSARRRSSSGGPGSTGWRSAARRGRER